MTPDRKSYDNAHKWVYYHYGKAKKCENNECVYPKKNSSYIKIDKPKRYEWANISGNYLKDISDWIQLCPSCHRKKDFTEELRLKIVSSHNGQEPVNRRKVNMTDIKGNVVDTFESITKASINTGILRTSIINNLSGRTKTAGGYIWTL